MTRPIRTQKDDGQRGLMACILLGAVSVAACLAWISWTRIEPATPGVNPDADVLAVSGGVLFLQSATLVVFILLLALGVRPDRRTKGFWIFLTLQLVAVLLNWWAILATYKAFLDTGQFNYVLGLPLPTALMIGGTWLSAMPLLIFYVWRFRATFYSRADEARFEDLLKDIRAGAAASGERV